MNRRIRTLQDLLVKSGMAAAVIWYSRDLLYYTGACQPSWLVVLPDTCRLFVRSNYAEAKIQATLDADQMEEERDMGRLLHYLRDHGIIKGSVIGTELDLLPVNLWRQWWDRMPEWTFNDVTPLILGQRQVKEVEEIDRIRRACRVMDLGHDRIRASLKSGMTELDAAAAIEDTHRREGHAGIYFMRHPDFFMARGLCASGPNLMRPSGPAFSLSGVGLDAAVPAGPSRRVIRPGDAVLIDIPVLVEGYHVDMARTYTAGAADLRSRELHRKLERLFAFAADILRPGITWGQGFRAVEAHADLLGVGHFFQRMAGGGKIHYIGHGIGLELNEPPLVTARNGDPILAGTVIALEMHLLHENEFALKMEDMLLIGEQENAFLCRTPQTLFEVLQP
jgi:Xaa-Pro aminopeptidase